MNLPDDHKTQLERARLSLDGLGIGDAFDEMMSVNCAAARRRADSELAAGPWWHTDETEMALSIYEVLARHGRVHADELAVRFGERFRRDPDRGYGKMARGGVNRIAQ